MDHSAERRLVPALFRLHAISVDGVDHNIVTSIITITACLVPKAHHLTSHRIEFRMRRERRRLHLAFEIISSNSLERHRIESKRRTVLFHR